MKSILVATTLLICTAAAGMPALAHEGSPVAVNGDALTRLVAIHPGDAALLAAGASGLYQLDGQDWTRIGPAPPGGAMVSSGGETPILLAGDHAPCMMGGAPVNAQRSEDGGASWTEIAGPTDLRPLAIWPQSGLALAASCAGLQVSLDAGLSWSILPGVEPGWDLTAFAEVTEVDEAGPVVLVGLTSEGGSTQLRRVDLSDPTAPAVSDILREYYAVGGLTGWGDTYVLAAMDGVWISLDAGVSWERSATGLEGIVLEADPLVAGLPVDFDPEAVGLFAAAHIPGTADGLVVGAIDGVYLGAAGEENWSRVDGAGGRVHQIVVSADGATVAYRTDAGVFLASLEPTTQTGVRLER